MRACVGWPAGVPRRAVNSLQGCTAPSYPYEAGSLGSVSQFSNAQRLCTGVRGPRKPGPALQVQMHATGNRHLMSKNHALHSILVVILALSNRIKK
jgi:hypothetical protein